MPRCPSCRQPVRWVETPNGRRMPLDPEKTHTGTVRITRGYGITLTQDELRANPWEPRYTPHFITCPNPPPKKGRRR